MIMYESCNSNDISLSNSSMIRKQIVDAKKIFLCRQPLHNYLVDNHIWIFHRLKSCNKKKWIFAVISFQLSLEGAVKAIVVKWNAVPWGRVNHLVPSVSWSTQKHSNISTSSIEVIAIYSFKLSQKIKLDDFIKTKFWQKRGWKPGTPFQFPNDLTTTPLRQLWLSRALNDT